MPLDNFMTAFAVITVILFAFMPKKNIFKIVWSLIILSLGFIITFSRVGVGAHYPLDVVISSTIGFIVAVISIKINVNLRWLDWIKNQRFYPIFILLLSIWTFMIVRKIIDHNLLIFYLSLMSLVVTLFVFTNAYVKKN